MRIDGLHPKLPLALLLGALLQAGGALWWAAQQGSAIRYDEVRLDAVETQLQGNAQLDRQLLDRLARIEERLSAQVALLSDLKSDLKRER